MKTQPLYQFLSSTLAWQTQAKGIWQQVAKERFDLAMEKLPSWVMGAELYFQNVREVDAGFIKLGVSYQVMTSHGYWSGYIIGQVTVSPCIIHDFMVSWSDAGFNNEWIEREESEAFDHFISEGGDPYCYEGLYWSLEAYTEYILDTLHEILSRQVECNPVRLTPTYDPTIAPEDQPRVPTPDEEPDAHLRRFIANQIPVERLGRVPTPDEEPDVGVRWRIACLIPAERLERVPTPEEEPDGEVRWEIARRIKENTR